MMSNIRSAGRAAATILKRLADFLATRNGKVLLLVLVVVMVTVQLAAMHRAPYSGGPGYTSDDVAQQTLLSQWQRGIRGGAVVGDDNWYLKFPLYFVMNQLPLSPDTRAFATSWVVTIVTMLGVVGVLWLVLGSRLNRDKEHRALMTLLPVGLVVSMSPLIFDVIASMNNRNIEIPLCMLLVAGLLWYRKETFSGRPHWIVLAMVMVGMLLGDDPMFTYMAAVLVVLALSIRAVLRPGRIRALVEVGGIVGGAVVLARVGQKVLHKLLPLSYLIHPRNFTHIDGFLLQIKLLFSRYLVLFNANIWEQHLNFAGMVVAANFVLVGILFWAAIRLIKYSGASERTLAETVIGWWPFWIVGVFLISGFDNVRYLVLLPFALALAFCVAVLRRLVNLRLAYIMVAAMFASGIYTTFTAAQMLQATAGNQANAEQKAAARVLYDRNATKGVASYWSANILTYMSNFQTDVASVNCDNISHTISYDPILSERGILDKPAEHTFALYSPESLGGHQECTLETLIVRLGQPDEIISLPGDRHASIAIYNRDVIKGLAQ